MRLLVTGSAGLIGAASVRRFASDGWDVHGIDNNMRREFFGAAADTTWQTAELLRRFPGFASYDLDIRDRDSVFRLFRIHRFDAVIHCAAQPSHDKAAEIPFVDFEVNAVATLNLLEAARQYAPSAPFVFMSTNKVYGDAPNHLALRETDTRWDFAEPEYEGGIGETFQVDQSLHSIFGASKLAADILVQEYGRYFDMPTVVLRGGCLTGPGHAGVELHGFLSYLLKCNLEGLPYTVYGYKGKQVRDNIHADDVTAFMKCFIANPKAGAVYNIGGGKDNSTSLLEAFHRAEAITGRAMNWSYSDEARRGDHICYYSDLSRAKHDYPLWSVQKDLQTTCEEIVEGWAARKEKDIPS